MLVYNIDDNIVKSSSKAKNLSLGFIAFLQALGLVTYCSLIGWLMWVAGRWFGPMATPFGITLFLVIFVTSAVISVLLVLGYPFLIFWEEKNTEKALKLVIYTTLWILAFVLLFITSLFFPR